MSVTGGSKLAVIYVGLFLSRIWVSARVYSCDIYASIMFCEIVFSGISEMFGLYPRNNLKSLSSLDPLTQIVRNDARGMMVVLVVLGPSLDKRFEISLKPHYFVRSSGFCELSEWVGGLTRYSSFT